MIDFLQFTFPILVYLPFVTFLLVLLCPRNHETLISRMAMIFSGLHFHLSLFFAISWVVCGATPLSNTVTQLYSSDSFLFFMAFYFDKVTATFLLVGSFLTFLITLYSRFYMHRESGYKRFFSTISLFYAGYTLIVLSGNFEMLFAGWEVLGLSSFLLIAFYRERYLPVRNALRVFSVYRLGDMGLLLTGWISHLIWHENITFAQLQDLQSVTSHISGHSTLGFAMAALIWLSAAAKSAQFPFSWWLPRAMEGPTPSSAIFYGSLSVNMGCFILLRTYPLWEHQDAARILMGLGGLVTALTANGATRVQTSIKAQVAYASLTQIGIMFVEISLGFHNLALFHFAGNAFLRTYQLLVSPSVVSYLIREQFYKPVAKRVTIEDNFSERLKRGLYVLSLQEWKMAEWMETLFWRPSKWVAQSSAKVLRGPGLFVISTLVAGVLAIAARMEDESSIQHLLAGLIAFWGLLLVAQAFAERKSPAKAWAFIAANHIWVASAVSLNDRWELEHLSIYLSGVVISWLIGQWTLTQLVRKHGQHAVSLSNFHGLVSLEPKLALVFLISCLGLSGFPITPTFMGEDLIFHHIHGEQVWMALCVALSYVFDGLAIMRIYSRLFLGHPNSIRST